MQLYEFHDIVSEGIPFCNAHHHNFVNSLLIAQQTLLLAVKYENPFGLILLGLELNKGELVSLDLVQFVISPVKIPLESYVIGI